MVKSLLHLSTLFLALAAVQAARNESAPFYPGEVLFIGASLMQYWKNEGLPVWNEFYAPLEAANVGVRGDQTQDTIDRLNSGYVDDLQPRVVVLNIGHNDLRKGKKEQYVYDQTGKILGMLQEKFPGVKIILLGLLPRTPASRHQKARNANELIKNYDDGTTVRFLDMSEKFCTGLGEINPDLYRSDGLHLTEDGYQKFAETMAPLFNEVLYS